MTTNLNGARVAAHYWCKGEHYVIGNRRPEQRLAIVDAIEASREFVRLHEEAYGEWPRTARTSVEERIIFDLRGDGGVISEVDREVGRTYFDWTLEATRSQYRSILARLELESLEVTK